MPRLENWKLIANHLYGEVYEDSRFPDGSEIRTSSVQEINEAEGYAQTRNTRYELGKQLDVEKVLRVGCDIAGCKETGTLHEFDGMKFCDKCWERLREIVERKGDKP